MILLLYITSLDKVVAASTNRQRPAGVFLLGQSLAVARAMTRRVAMLLDLATSVLIAKPFRIHTYKKSGEGHAPEAAQVSA